MTAGSRVSDAQHLSLPFSAESVGVARHAIERWFAPQGRPADVVDDCRLVMSELVGNSVRHARPLNGGTMDVDWACSDGALEISVTDGGGSTEPHLLTASATDVSGRGLTIVEALTTRWWIESSDSRTTVRAEVRVA